MIVVIIFHSKSLLVYQKTAIKPILKHFYGLLKIMGKQILYDRIQI